MNETETMSLKESIERVNKAIREINKAIHILDEPEQDFVVVV